MAVALAVALATADAAALADPAQQAQHAHYLNIVC